MKSLLFLGYAVLKFTVNTCESETCIERNATLNGNIIWSQQKIYHKILPAKAERCVK